MSYHAIGIFGLFGFTSGYVLLLTFCEFLNRKMSVEAEYTRKLSHVAAVLSALFFFPLVFKNVGYALGLSVLFFVALVIANVKKILPSIDNVERKTGGSYFLAFGIGVTYYISVILENSMLFTLPMLIFAFSDPLAGLVGGKWIKSKCIIGGKTIAGSLTFLFTTLCICLLFFNSAYHRPMFTLSLMIAFTATVTELVSTRGTDNFTVPLVVAGMLIFHHFFAI